MLTLRSRAGIVILFKVIKLLIVVIVVLGPPQFSIPTSAGTVPGLRVMVSRCIVSITVVPELVALTVRTSALRPSIPVIVIAPLFIANYLLVIVFVGSSLTGFVVGIWHRGGGSSKRFVE